MTFVTILVKLQKNTIFMVFLLNDVSLWPCLLVTKGSLYIQYLSAPPNYENPEIFELIAKIRNLSYLELLVYKRHENPK